jgi:hypothetical protein
MGTLGHGDMGTLGHGDMGQGIAILGNFDVLRKKSNGKQKPRRFFLIHFLLAYRVIGGLLFVPLWTKKQMKVIRLQTD